MKSKKYLSKTLGFFLTLGLLLAGNVYAVAVPSIELGASSGTSGDIVSISGAHFNSSATINVTIDGHTGNIETAAITTNPGGAFSGSITIPADATVGADTVTATDGTNTATASFTVTASDEDPAIVVTDPATAITSADATLNGTNGGSAAVGHSFWASLSPFSTASPVLPSGVYSTPDMGALAADTAFSASLSSVVGLPAITPNTTYYFAAWVNIDGTWHPGEMLSFTTLPADESPSTVAVTIVKYVDGAPATAEATESASFAMNASWDADNIGSGSGSYSLGPVGFNNDNPYQATTADMSSGASYSTSEVMNESVGASCDVDGVEYALEGYSIGNTLEEAESADIVDEAALTDITSDKYVIVWNDDCATAETEEPVTVTIVKYVDGAPATAESTGGDSFTMNATWDADNIGSGSGSYSLAADNDTPYSATTVELAAHADYSTSEVIDSQTGASCDAETQYALVGYLVGDSLADALEADMTDTAALTNITDDKYVIVLNDLCSTDDNDGTIGGDVEGTGELAVTSVETLDGSAVANDSYADGWKYRFNITVPTDETGIAMKFSNWTETGGDGTIPAANNMRISSAQADNGGATITVTGADTYTTPDLNITGDLDPETDGLQIQVIVEVKIPSGTDSGSYTTNYGVRSQ